MDNPSFLEARENLRKAMEVFRETCPHDLVFDKEVATLAAQVQPYAYSSYGGYSGYKER